MLRVNPPTPGRNPVSAAVRQRPAALALSVLTHAVVVGALLVAGVGAVPPRPLTELPVELVFEAPAPVAESAPEPAPADPPPVVQPPPPEPAPPPPEPTPPPPEPAPPPVPIAKPRPAPVVRRPAPPSPPRPSPPEPAPVAAAPPPVTPPPPSPALVSAAWRQALAAWLTSRKTYPDEARRSGTEGGVVLRFTADRSGRVRDVVLVRSSGSPVLDSAAQAMLRGAALPAFTQEMPADSVTVTVQVHYGLTD